MKLRIKNSKILIDDLNLRQSLAPQPKQRVNIPGRSLPALSVIKMAIGQDILVGQTVA